MRVAQQKKIYKNMNEAQRGRVAKFIEQGLNRNTAMMSVVIEDLNKARTQGNSSVSYGDVEVGVA